MQIPTALPSALLFIPALAALAALAACSSGAPPGDGSRATSAAVSSTSAPPIDLTDPAVGFVYLEGGGDCSGTLIAPNIVLTAGRCVLADKGSLFLLGTQQPGETSDTRESFDIDLQAAYPTLTGTACTNSELDIGLYHLAESVTDVTPLAYGADAHAALGVPCRNVGFDRDGDKIATDVTVSVFDPLYLTAKPGTWSAVGFSETGGALVCGGSLIASVSCFGDTSGSYARTDAAASWVAGQIAAWKCFTTTECKLPNGQVIAPSVDDDPTTWCTSRGGRLVSKKVCPND